MKTLLLIAVILGAGLGFLICRKRALTEGGTAGIGPAGRTVQAMVDGKPVHSYISED